MKPTIGEERDAEMSEQEVEEKGGWDEREVEESKRELERERERKAEMEWEEW